MHSKLLNMKKGAMVLLAAAVILGVIIFPKETICTLIGGVLLALYQALHDARPRNKQHVK